jgi:transposase
MVDYTGKTLFVGIDVHKQSYSVTVICEKAVVKRDRLVASPEALISYLQKRFGSGTIISAYEAGFCGFSLHRKLEAVGIKNLVVHAAAIEISHSRVKTDKRDSMRIALHLAEGKLKSIHIPSPKQEDDRAVTRLRDSLIEDRVRLSNQIKSLLLAQGLIKTNDSRRVTAKWIKEMANLEMDPGMKLSFDTLMFMWFQYDGQIKAVEEEMKKQALRNKEVDEVYQSVPGIGPITGRVLANELGDMTQFNTEGQLFSYGGLTPSEHSSGENVRQGHITKQGKPILRKLLVQAAWTAVRYNKGIRDVFDRIALKAGSKRAIIGIARRLLGHIRACFRTKTLYRSCEKMA